MTKYNLYFAFLNGTFQNTYEKPEVVDVKWNFLIFAL